MKLHQKLHYMVSCKKSQELPEPYKHVKSSSSGRSYIILNAKRNKLKVCLVTQLCLTHHDPMDCRPPGSSVHGDSPGKNTGVGCHALLQGIFPTQGSNPGLLHCR